MELLADTMCIGIGASLVMDLWMLVRRQVFAVPLPNYAHVGRWLGHMRRGRFRHADIARATPVRHEAVLGWTAHYLTGVAYAALLPALWGAAWLHAPTPGPALVVGLFTVAAPFLLMQPGTGAGLAARRTPRPNVARLHTLTTHLVFGLGLYLTAVVLRAFNG